MVDGRLVALDTPANLKRTKVPDRVFALRGPSLVQAADMLRAMQGIRAAEPFGAGMHVRADPAIWSTEAVASALRDAGGNEIEVEESEPTLEDVFLAVAGAREAT